ncbi:serine/arginine repetitive matrix protein 2-like [Oncorhynchus kisutch]|uniref:serine/arginine repetitive matrix protein 2-like n=1 Tax=Oncorhynchus kisutch TaxID=8019 RepID=UPI0012DDA376|nr:serine/arginine repetitive matrix protein 2-like [Oncorhynchus kisutch]
MVRRLVLCLVSVDTQLLGKVKPLTSDPSQPPAQQLAQSQTGEEVVTEEKHLHMGSMTMPAPPQLACEPGFAVRSQSLHSVGINGGGEEEVGSPTSRKQPPPKPRRDPATKLSISSETVEHSPTLVCRGCRANPDAPQGCGEDCKRIPPPKPRRNPKTQLSTSFDDSCIRKHIGSKSHSPSAECERNPSPPSDESPSHHSDSDEPVYIEMGASVGGGGYTEAPKSEDEELGESVYEEMKYPLLDDMDYCWDPPGCRSTCPPPALLDPEPLHRCSTPRNIPLCGIPAPFPNLLTHRPPLLVFPPAPAQCSPNSDESPLTPLDPLTKLPMMDNPCAYNKSPTSSSEPPLAHLCRELTATPTLTVSGRSSAPPLPCTLYKSSASSAHGYQRSQSACPSPVSMGRCITPLSLMRTPPFDAPMPLPGGLPCSASTTPHGKGSPPQDCIAGGRLHGSMQNVSTGRSRTPTSPLDELTNLFTAGRNMMKKNTGGRKSKEPGETESKSKSHSVSKRDGKERHSHKESKRESKDRSKEYSSHLRNTKDRSCSSVEPLPRRYGKDRVCNSVELLPMKMDSRDRGCNSVEPLPMKQDSRDRGCNSVEPLPMKQDSRDRGCNSVEPLPMKQDSRDRGCNSVEPLPMKGTRKDQCCNSVEPLPMKMDSKGRGCKSVELPPVRRDSKDRSVHGMEPLLQLDRKDSPRNGVESRHDSKDSPRNGVESRHDRKDSPRNGVESRHDSKDSPRNGMESRHDSKDSPRNGVDSRHDSKDSPRNGMESRHDSKDSPRNGVESRHDSKDSPWNGVESRHDSKHSPRSGVESRPDSKERLSHQNPPELLPRQDSKDQNRNGIDLRHDSKVRMGQPPELLPRQDSKDQTRNGMDSRHESKEQMNQPPELLPREDSKDQVRNGMDSRYDSKERMDQPPELLPRQKSKDSPRNGIVCRRNGEDRDRESYCLESRHEGKEQSYNGMEPFPPLPRQEIKESDRNGLEARRDSKDRSCNGSELPPRRDSYGKSANMVDLRCVNKDRVGHSSEVLPRRDVRDRGTYSVEQSKAQARNGVSGQQQSSTATPTRHGRPAGSPPMVFGSGNTELKPALTKYGHSSSAPVTPSPLGTPQRQASEAQMPWKCGDSTMLEQIERKHSLCVEIRSRQQPDRNTPDRNLCKQDSMPTLPIWGKSSGAKKIRPPPYPTQTTVFWDTAI